MLQRTIIGLLPKWHGKIEVLGVDLDTASEQHRRALERRWGVLFQQARFLLAHRAPERSSPCARISKSRNG